MCIPANEIAESQEEGDDATSRTVKEHGSVTKEHGDEEMEIGGESEGKVREKNTDGGGVEVFREATGNEAP